MSRKRTTKPEDQELRFEAEQTEPAPQEPAEPTPAAIDPEVAAAVKRVATFAVPTPTQGGAPPWVKIPSGFTFPRHKAFIFVKFRAEWTDTPWKGEPIINPETGVAELNPATGEIALWRHCICWPINVADKKLAIGRANGDNVRAVDEMCKQMIRACDGEMADWAMGAGPHDIFWNEVGEKCRVLLARLFTKLHMLQPTEMSDFLEHCVEVRSGVS